MPEADPFHILGLPRTFDLDPDAIEGAYLAASMARHPDLADATTRIPGVEPTDAMARLNQARDVLLDPEQRAGALLKLLGGPGKEQDRSLPPGFLAAMMERSEAMEAECAGRDPAALSRWRAWAQGERERSIAEARALFAGVGEPPDPAALRAIRSALNAWRYIERLIERLDRPEASGGKP